MRGRRIEEWLVVLVADERDGQCVHAGKRIQVSTGADGKVRSLRIYTDTFGINRRRGEFTIYQIIMAVANIFQSSSTNPSPLPSLRKWSD